jgi:hypothetical protein
MGCFSDLFCGKLPPFCEKNKFKIILSQIPFFKKNNHNWNNNNFFCQNHPNWLQCESCLIFSTLMFWSPNFIKYSYWWLPLEQNHKTATYSNLLTNILIMIEMEANWDLNLLALPLDRRLSIGVGSGDKPLALNSLG